MFGFKKVEKEKIEKDFMSVFDARSKQKDLQFKLSTAITTLLVSRIEQEALWDLVKQYGCACMDLTASLAVDSAEKHFRS